MRRKSVLIPAPFFTSYCNSQGFKNYKPFVLFLFYAGLLAVYVAGVSMWSMIQVLDVDMEVSTVARPPSSYHPFTSSSALPLMVSPNAGSYAIHQSPLSSSD